MILTDRAKEDFLNWYYNKYLNDGYCSTITNVEAFFKTIHQTFKQALIIEWLDVVEIYPIIVYCTDKTFDSYVTVNTERIECSQFNKTRQEVTQQAILKANEIYNNLNQ